MISVASYFLPRDLHPAAWWIWAIGLATAASRTTNPLLLAVILAVVIYVVVARRSDSPWALSFRLYLYLGLFVVIFRVAFRFVFSGGGGQTILFHLPEIPLPDIARGIQLFGDISAESLLGGFYDGLRLATMLICLGAANSLANPKRLLRSMPPALYEIGTAIVVAVSVFPQLAESIIRVNRARKLRGISGRSFRVLKTIVIPVMEDALDRSLHLAASMDSRGYGRLGTAARRERAVTGTLMIGGLIGICVGTYASLDATTPRYLAAPVLAAGSIVALIGFVVAGKRVQRTRYRPDRWQLAEIITAASGLGAAIVLIAVGSFDPGSMYSATMKIAWPELGLVPLIGVVVGVLPAFLTPPPAFVAIGSNDKVDA